MFNVKQSLYTGFVKVNGCDAILGMTDITSEVAAFVKPSALGNSAIRKYSITDFLRFASLVDMPERHIIRTAVLYIRQ